MKQKKIDLLTPFIPMIIGYILLAVSIFFAYYTDTNRMAWIGLAFIGGSMFNWK